MGLPPSASDEVAAQVSVEEVVTPVDGDMVCVSIVGGVFSISTLAVPLSLPL